MAKTLKEKNVLGHTIFLSVNAVALIGVLKVQDILAQGWTSLWADMEQVVGEAALPFLVHIINGLVSADNKVRLVFWRWRHPLPGTRAFSEILHSDPRLEPRMVTARLGPLPVDPVEQNRLWYQFYKTVQEVPKVADVHRLFLLARDYTAFSALFLEDSSCTSKCIKTTEMNGAGG